MAIKFHYNEVLEGKKNRNYCTRVAASCRCISPHWFCVRRCDAKTNRSARFPSVVTINSVCFVIASDPLHVPAHLQRAGKSVRRGAKGDSLAVPQRAGAVHRAAAGDSLGRGHADAAGRRTRGSSHIILLCAACYCTIILYMFTACNSHLAYASRLSILCWVGSHGQHIPHLLTPVAFACTSVD